MKKMKTGGRNLVLNSNQLIENNLYNMASYYVTPEEGGELSNGCGYLVEGESYTCYMCVTPTEQIDNFSLFTSDGYAKLCSMQTNGFADKIVVSAKFVAEYDSGKKPTDKASNAAIRVFRFPNDNSISYKNAKIHWIKIVNNKYNSDWSPAPEDLATVDALKKLNERVTALEDN